LFNQRFSKGGLYTGNCDIDIKNGGIAVMEQKSRWFCCNYPRFFKYCDLKSQKSTNRNFFVLIYLFLFVLWLAKRVG